MATFVSSAMASMFGESSKLFNFPRKTTIIGLNVDRKQEKLIATHEDKAISLLKCQGDDHQALKDWSTSPSNRPLCPAVLDGQGIISCVFQNILRTWNEKTAVLDKAKKHTLPKDKDIWQIFPCVWETLLLLYKDGTYSTTPSMQDVAGNKQNGKPLWCGMSETKTQETFIVMCFQKENKLTVVSLRFDKDGNTLQEQVTPLAITDNTPVSFALLPAVSQPVILVYTKQKHLISIPLQSGSSEECIHTFGAEVHPQANITAVDSQHIAISGIQQDTEFGFGIWDVKFNLLKAWNPYPGKCSQPKQISLLAGRLLVVCDTAVFSIPFFLPSSSLSAALGKMPPTYKQDAPYTKFIEKLSNPDATPKYASFKSAFTSLVDALSKSSPSDVFLHQLTAPVLRRSIAGETKFWPRDELELLIRRQWVPTYMISELLSALSAHGEVYMMYLCLCTQPDLPEVALLRCLSTFLNASEEQVGKVCDEGSIAIDRIAIKADTDVTVPTRPFSEEKITLINKVLKASYNDVFLLSCLKSLDFSNTLELLKYLHYLLAATSASKDSKRAEGLPTLLQVVDWAGLLLDTHFTQLVLSADAREILVELHSMVESQVQFYGELVTLDGILSTLRERCTPPIAPKVGMYCIQTLHVQ